MLSLLAVIVVSSIAGPQRKRNNHALASDTRFGLQLTVQLDRKTFQLEDTPILKIALKNMNETPIAIYKRLGWGGSSSFSLIILDEKDKAVIGRMIDDAKPAPPFTRDDFVVIQPGETIRQERALGFESKGITTPGVYKFIVMYHSPVPNEFAPKDLVIWPMENGVLQAKPVTFNVTQ